MVPADDALTEPSDAEQRELLNRYVGTFEATTLHVLTIDRDGIARLDLFHTPQLFPAFGLPASM